jgi:Flp pilus assembly protein TadG
VVRGERGVTLVEFALILPLFMMLVLGMVTGGHAYFRKISITDAVREGARYGVTYPADLGNLSAWQNAVKARVVEASGGELKTADVCAELVKAPDADTSAPCHVTAVADPGGTDGEWLVKVTARGTAKLEWLVSSTDVELRGKSVAKYEREPA